MPIKYRENWPSSCSFTFSFTLTSGSPWTPLGDSHPLDPLHVFSGGWFLVPRGGSMPLRLDDLGTSLAPLLSKILHMYPVTYWPNCSDIVSITTLTRTVGLPDCYRLKLLLGLESWLGLWSNVHLPDVQHIWGKTEDLHLTGIALFGTNL